MAWQHGGRKRLDGCRQSKKKNKNRRYRLQRDLRVNLREQSQKKRQHYWIVRLRQIRGQLRRLRQIGVIKQIARTINPVIIVINHLIASANKDADIWAVATEQISERLHKIVEEEHKKGRE